MQKDWVLTLKYYRKSDESGYLKNKIEVKIGTKK